MILKKLLILSVIILCACGKMESNIPVAAIKANIASNVKLPDAMLVDLKGNTTACERYGVSVLKLEDGFVYTNGEKAEDADEIIVIKATDKRALLQMVDVLEKEITKLSNVWEGVDDEEYKKVRRHILKSKGNYVLLAIGDDSKEAEKIFDSFFQ